MRRNDTRNLRNLPKLRHEFRLLHCWRARRLAQTSPTASQWVHSCLSSSTHPPSETFLPQLATAGQQHDPHQWSSPPQTNAHGHAPQRDPSWSSSSVAPAHPRSMDFRGNPARATQVFPDATADHGQSDDYLGKTATLQDVHKWARRYSSGIPDSKKGWAYW